MQADLPETRDALYRLASSQRRAQRVPEALDTLKRLEKLYPPFGGLFEELGFCLLAINVATNAIAAFERAVGLNRCLLESWRALESLYRASDRMAEMRTAAAQVQQLAALPGEIQLACRKLFDGEPRVAEDLVRQYIAVHGEHVEALRLLAKIASDAGAEFDAELLLQRAVALAPEHDDARHEFALALLRRRKHEPARAQIARLLATTPANRTYRVLLAEAAAGVGDYDKALPVYGELLKETPQDPELYRAIGDALKTTGKTQEAIDSYRYALAAKPGFGQAFWGLASIRDYRFTDADITLMQQHETSTATTPLDRYHLCFALGTALEDRGRFAESWNYYERANALKRATLRYRAEALERTARLQSSFCTSEFFESRKGYGCESSAPLFIVGLPCSGSTLVERILAAHSRVDDALELADIPRLAQELHSSEPGKRLGYPGVLGALTAGMCKGFGERYLWETTPYRTNKVAARAPHFIDKFTNNFQHLDLVHLIFPNAKILDVRRAPLAAGCDIFRHLFATGHPFAYSFEDIARYHRTYVELMTHWERVLPGKILRVQYEDLGDDFESGVRRILEFCGLEFEPECVRLQQPVEKEEIDRWRHFERWLTPLKRALAPDGNA